jgi:hypothetical protein
MAVTLTSPALGQDAGTTYTGDEEEHLLARGLARRDGYTGPGVSNTGPAAELPSEDPSLAVNREPAPERFEDGTEDPGPLDPALFQISPDTEGGEDYDFDEGGVNDDAPVLESVEPANQPLAGGAATLRGQNFEGTTGVTVGGTAATNRVVVSDTEVTCTFPAKAAGTYAVAITNATGTDTEAGAVTYA